MTKRLVLILMAAIGVLSVQAQDPTVNRYGNDKVAQILSNFKNYRYGSVYVYEVTSPEIFKEMYTSLSGPAAGSGATAESVAQFEADYKEAYDYMMRALQSGETATSIERAYGTRGIAYDPTLFTEAYDIKYNELYGGGTEKEYKVYVITSEPEGQSTDLNSPEKIYGAVVYSAPFVDMQEGIGDNLIGQQDIKNVYSYKRLLDSRTPEATYIQSKFPTYENMYELIEAQFLQGNVKSKTMEARSIEPGVWYGDENIGVAKSLLKNQANPTDQDVQAFKRISTGEPMDFNGRHQVVVSQDLIQWKMFDQNIRRDRQGKPMIDTLTGQPLLDERYASNNNLPSLGFEIKYGIDDINYYSLWSGRMAVNAMWDYVKLGVILPTSGWAVMSEDVFSQDRTMTSAGFGVNAAIDFPFPLIQNSGVFSASVAYNFGDADPADYKTLEFNPNTFQFSEYSTDYAMRLNGQLLYTIAMAIDDDYMLRIGLGGSVYQVEGWEYNRDSLQAGALLDPDVDTDQFYFNDESLNETIGGITGRIEFMATNDNTPYGASLQYFDSQIGYEGWLQFNVIDETLAFKLAVMGYANAFRDAHPWEIDGLFLPTLRAIYTF